MDPLSQIIALLRPRALLWKQLEARGDWAIRFPANDGVVFSFVASGHCVFQAQDHETRMLSEGDFLILAGPPEWTLGHRLDSVPIAYDHSQAETGARTNYLGNTGDAPSTRILGGRFEFDETNAGLLEGLFPAILVVRSIDDGAARLRNVLGLLGEEVAENRPGRALLLERLLDVMLIQALRNTTAGPETGRQSLLAGLADAQVAPALRAIHAEVANGWTVGQLAALCGMSRSVFAERFSRAVGLPPMDYVLRWRMALAKDALRTGCKRLTEVAFASGYSSVSAFSTAFTRTVGSPPSYYAAPRPRVGVDAGVPKRRYGSRQAFRSPTRSPGP